MQQLDQPTTAALHVTIGATLITWLPYLDLGLRVIASLIAIYSGVLYIRKLRGK